MCEITRKWMGIGYEEGMVQGYTNGKSDGKMETIITQLTKKLGYLSENIIIKINNSDEDVLNELIINIFDIDKEEDVLKYTH